MSDKPFVEPLLRRGDALPNGQIVERDLYPSDLWDDEFAQPDTDADGRPIDDSDMPGWPA